MHRSLLLAAALGCACTTLPGGENVHLIRAHWAGESCAPTAAPPAATTRIFDLEALGDFPPSIDTSEELDGARALVVPGTTRGVAMTARVGINTYQGLGEAVGEGRDIDVSLWPASAPCRLDSGPDDCDYPGTSAADSAAIGVSGDGRTLVVAGGSDFDAARTALVVDLATGAASCAKGSRGMQRPRSGAQITPFGDKMLVSGGYDPRKAVAQLNAEVFDPTTKRFDPELVALNELRAHHAAVTLSSGEVLLVGGVGEGGTPLDSLEVLKPESNLHRADVATLPGVRVDPVALRLTDDEIFVGGGTDAPMDGAPVPDLIWLSPDATAIDRRLVSLSCPDDLSGDRTAVGAFAAMPGGAVLAVGGCTLPPEGAGPLDCAEHCAGQPLGCPSSEIFWIDRDANVTCCDSERTQCGPRKTSGLPSLANGGWTDPVLVAGAEGSPWLLEGAKDARRFHRFDPWGGQFGTAALVSSAKPVSLVAADRGLFLWLEDAGDGTAFALQGFRHGVRGRYTQAVAPLLLAGGDGIVADRAPSPAPNVGEVAERPFRAADGAVELPPGTELLVTDTTYADVDVVVDIVKGPPPLMRVGSDVFGGDGCPWPQRKASASLSFSAELTRRAGGVTLTIDGKQKPCKGPTGRASLAIAADAVRVTLSRVTVTRLPVQ